MRKILKRFLFPLSIFAIITLSSCTYLDSIRSMRDREINKNQATTPNDDFKLNGKAQAGVVINYDYNYDLNINNLNNIKNNIDDKTVDNFNPIYEFYERYDYYLESEFINYLNTKNIDKYNKLAKDYKELEISINELINNISKTSYYDDFKNKYHLDIKSNRDINYKYNYYLSISSIITKNKDDALYDYIKYYNYFNNDRLYDVSDLIDKTINEIFPKYVLVTNLYNDNYNKLSNTNKRFVDSLINSNALMDFNNLLGKYFNYISNDYITPYSNIWKTNGNFSINDSNIYTNVFYSNILKTPIMAVNLNDANIYNIIKSYASYYKLLNNEDINVVNYILEDLSIILFSKCIKENNLYNKDIIENIERYAVKELYKKLIENAVLATFESIDDKIDSSNYNDIISVLYNKFNDDKSIDINKLINDNILLYGKYNELFLASFIAIKINELDNLKENYLKLYECNELNDVITKLNIKNPQEA